MKSKISILLLVFLIPLSAPLSASAQDETTQNKPWERFSISLGGFLNSLDSNIEIGSETAGVGIVINAEDALDLDTRTVVFRSDLGYRFGGSRSHRLELNYLGFRRNASKTLGAEIEFNGKTYAAATTIDSFLDIDVFKVGYTYSFFQDDRFDLAVGLGAYVMPIDIGLQNSDGTEASSKSVTAPLPVLTVRFDFAFTPKVFLRQNLDVFYLELDQFKGSLVDSRVALEYNPWERVGLGIGLDNLELSLQSKGEDYPNIDFFGRVDFRYSGLMLYGKYFF